MQDNATEHLADIAINSNDYKKIIPSIISVSRDATTSHEFVSYLLEIDSPQPLVHEKKVEQAMQILERIADESPAAGCALMLHLWEFANNLHMHDICNSIDLWIFHCKSEIDINDHVRYLLNHTGDTELQKHYRDMIGQQD